ncbi:MAG: response regulator [Chloroflexi bacterium]|nr:response regulator [Chloroflexota bacterium]
MKVLVADDNANSRQLVKDIVESIGYETILAYDGPKALVAAQTQSPDLIILDVNMPGMSGFEVCAAIKADPKLAQIPILMLTALADVENRVTGLGLGADDYLSKPFSPRELAARVNARLRTKAEADDLRKTKELLRQTFERFVSPVVVEKLMQDPTQIKLGGQIQNVTVFFADLEGFTSISERTDPEKLLHILNQYHALIVSVIQNYAGTVDKFIGDGVMALYNTPLHLDDHALRAVITALHIRDALAEFYAQFEPEYRMRVNFGIHTGPAVVGNVGAPNLMNFTAVGDTVNLAARLQDLSSGGRILISEACYNHIEVPLRITPIGYQTVKGRKEAVMIYEVLELAS